MTVDDLARTNPVAATRRAPIPEVATLMRDEGVGSVVVVEDDRPVGIVTDRDIALEVAAKPEDPSDVTAEDVMTAGPVTVDRHTGVMELTRTMSDNSVRRVPVVDDGDLYGIITLDDLDRLLSRERQNLADVVAAESPAY